MRVKNFVGMALIMLIAFLSLPEMICAENENWEIYTNKSQIETLFLSDDLSTLWVGTDGGGLEARDAITGQLIKIYTSKVLPSNRILSLLSDNEGGLWVGTRGGGLAHLNSDGLWEIFNEDNSDLPSNYVIALASDGDGGTWIGTITNGLANFKANGTWEIFNEDNSNLPNDYITSLLSDAQGGVWIGTKGVDLFGGETSDELAHLKFDGTWEIFNENNSDFPNNYAYSLISDGKGVFG